MTELIWEGKYKDGKKVAPVRIALPFQTIETVNESVQERQRALDLSFSGKQTEWRNRLIWGDKKYVLPSLLPEFAGKINLIYIDPPFATGADFSFMATIPDNPESEEDESSQFTKEASIIEQKAYRDTWGKGLDSYLQWFYGAAVLLRELLTENGSIFVHCDWRVNSFLRVVLDEIFGTSNHRAEVCWKKATKTTAFNDFGSEHDSILLYSKNYDNFTFNQLFRGLEDDQIKKNYVYVEKEDGTIIKLTKKQIDGIEPVSKGKRFRTIPITNMNKNRPNLKYEFLGHTQVWAKSKDKLVEEYKQGLIIQAGDGTIPVKKQYLESNKGVKVNDLWIDIAPVQGGSLENTGYPTQKPEKLLSRIIESSSDGNDIIADFFCGSGTTLAVAEKLGRRWIGSDLGRFAIHTTRKRLLQIPDLKPFVVQNLGKYERQVWQGAEFSNHENRNLQEKDYRNFILDLYHAEPVNGYVWLHGFKAGRMVHVGAVDSPVALGDVKSIIQEFWKSVGKPTDKVGEVRYNGVDILGWEFAFDINETAKQQAAASKVDVKFKKIPREVLDKRAVDAGDVKFFELAALDVKIKSSSKKVEVSLNDFVIPPDDVPEDVQKAITHWSQWIDYWAVDWDYKDDTFHNQWQSYRTKKNPKIELSTSYTYPDKGKYTIVVKVIDILGNDTTKAINVEIK